MTSNLQVSGRDEAAVPRLSVLAGLSRVAAGSR
jgi:hypothetical protein